MAAVSAYFEKKGIPVVTEVSALPNVKKMFEEQILANGVPALRYIAIPPNQWVEKCPEEYLPKFLEALTKTLSDVEKRSGKYKPPTAPRIAMTGTYDEVQEFFTGDLSTFVSTPPQAMWTDGLPITPPTPEAVARMLKGTSHKPDEIVNPAVGPMKRPVTVEKVAINAVMAGCKPEHLPLCLAITEGGLKNPWGSNSSMGIVNIVSGPIVKQLGMNSEAAILSPGNPANMAIGRFVALAIRNLAVLDVGSTNLNSFGTNLMGLTLPESPDTPWEGLNVRYGFSPKESVILHLNYKVNVIAHGTSEMMLMRKDTKVPEKLISTLKAFVPIADNTGRIIIVSPEAARSWRKNYGWETMAQLQDFLWDNITWPRKNYDLSSWWGSRLPFKVYVADVGGPRGSRMLNPDHVDLPPEAMVPTTVSPKNYIILVAGGVANSNDVFSWGTFGTCTLLPIDKWK